jgi:membrane-associated PAP2 superfamily phosphatase
MSHTLWAGIFVWLACLLTALAFYGRARLDQPVLQKHERRVAVAQAQAAS